MDNSTSINIENLQAMSLLLNIYMIRSIKVNMMSDSNMTSRIHHCQCYRFADGTTITKRRIRSIRPRSRDTTMHLRSIRARLARDTTGHFPFIRHSTRHRRAHPLRPAPACGTRRLPLAVNIRVLSLEMAAMRNEINTHTAIPRNETPLYSH